MQLLALFHDLRFTLSPSTPTVALAYVSNSSSATTSPDVRQPFRPRFNLV
jgi:hypothetical protein